MYSFGSTVKWEELGNTLCLENQVCTLQNSSSKDRCVLALLSAWISTKCEKEQD